MKKLLLFIAMFSSCCFPIYANENSINESSAAVIEPRKDVLVWRYKEINGHTYKRLFNLTKNRWETDWIKC